jgi:two-component system, NtrC family, sensor kinase
LAPSSRAAIEQHGPPRPGVGDAPLAELVILTRDGQERIVEVAPARSVVYEGKPARLVVGRDVTDRVRLRERLLVADRLGSIGLLAEGVAHGVNDPLAEVAANIELAAREVAGLAERAPLSKHVLSVALEGVERIRVIVREPSCSRAPTTTLPSIRSTCAPWSSRRSPSRHPKLTERLAWSKATVRGRSS